jgi:hypothetical protein
MQQERLRQTIVPIVRVDFAVRGCSAGLFLAVPAGLTENGHGANSPAVSFPVQDLATEISMEAIGRKRWVIPEGFIPSRSMANADRPLISHEAFCVINAGDAEAHIEVTLFFENREPVGPYRLTLEGRRTRHYRFNELEDPEKAPLDTDYASVIECDVPIVVQHTRLDSRSSEIALLSTIAWPAD